MKPTFAFLSGLLLGIALVVAFIRHCEAGEWYVCYD
jgi:hypothetical protein